MSISALSRRKLFGMIALSLGYITKEQLQECLDVQQLFTVPLQLGAIMLARGILTQEQLDAIIRVQTRAQEGTARHKSKTGRRRLLGEILIERGYINKQSLSTALERQEVLRKNGFSPRIGELLIYLGHITPEQLRHALVAQNQASA